jgi:hypothetical protein
MGTCVGTDHDEVIVKGLDVLQECAANDQPLINEFIAVSVMPFLFLWLDSHQMACSLVRLFSLF